MQPHSITKPCILCGKAFSCKRQFDFNRQKYCSQSCATRSSKSRDLVTRFWEKVQKSDGCWEWTAHRGYFGYGRIMVAKKAQPAHRISWELANGPIPKGLFVCHSCDNPPCVRPDHLFLGTQADNMRDMGNKGRQPHGENHRNAKFSLENIREMKRLRIQGMAIRAIARQFNTNRIYVRDILSGKAWRHDQ